MSQGLPAIEPIMMELREKLAHHGTFFSSNGGSYNRVYEAVCKAYEKGRADQVERDLKTIRDASKCL